MIPSDPGSHDLSQTAMAAVQYIYPLAHHEIVLLALFGSLILSALRCTGKPAFAISGLVFLATLALNVIVNIPLVDPTRFLELQVCTLVSGLLGSAALTLCLSTMPTGQVWPAKLHCAFASILLLLLLLGSSGASLLGHATSLLQVPVSHP